MSVVILGNPNPQHNGRKAEHLNQSETRVELWDGIDDPKAVELALSTDNDRDLVARASRLPVERVRYALAVHEIEDLWKVHARGVRPSYVVSDDAELQATLADYFGCPAGQPTALLTNGGRDAMHGQHWGTSAAAAQFNYLAISSDAGTGFAATDTTLVSELTTNGLARAAATYAHTAGTNTSTLTKTWTYTGSTSQTIASCATFNAATAGTLGEEDALSASITVTANGDTATVTYTGTAG